jgi:hypothetical protein
MPAFLRLVKRDNQAPLLLTLWNEHGDEIASATAANDEAAVKSAILLLARSETLRPGSRLTVRLDDDTRDALARLNAARKPGSKDQSDQAGAAGALALSHNCAHCHDQHGLC